MSTSTDSRNWKHTGDNQFTKPLTVETVSLTGANITNNIGTYNYIIEKVGATYYARSITNTLYSGSVASTVINSAITALTSGGKIYIKAGTYDITDYLAIQNVNNLKIEGEGWNKTILTTSNSTSNTYQIFKINGVCDNIEICGLGLASTGVNATESKALIHMADYAPGSVDPQISNLNIHHCSFTNANINANAVAGDFGLDDAYFKDITFKNNYLYNVGRCGFEVIDHYVASRSVNNYMRIDISDNYFTNIGVQDVYGIGISFGVDHAGVLASDITVANNTFYEMRKNQAIEIAMCDRVNVYGNNIKNVTYHTTGISLASSTNVNISNNNIDLADPDSPGTKSTPSLPLTLLLSTNVSVTGNNLKGNQITLNDCSKVAINGNTISTLGYYAIQFFATTTYCKITGNTIDCSRSDWVPSAVIYVSHAGTAYNEITDNLLIGASATVADFQNGGTSLDNIYEKKESYAVPSEIGTTMKLAPGNQFILVTSGQADRMVLLPEACTNLIGIKVRGKVGVNGFELRVATSQATTVYLNNVTTNVEAAIPANTIFEAELIDATHWILKTWTLLGAENTPIIPDAI